MKPQRLDRINSLLKEVIFEVIQQDVRNPHIKVFITVTKVETTADLHHAKVWVTMIASEPEKAKVIQALQGAAGFIAVHASQKMQIRYFPELIFKLDTGLEAQMKIETILGKIAEERNARESQQRTVDGEESGTHSDE
jgi:ribosome-binding factor A